MLALSETHVVYITRERPSAEVFSHVLAYLIREEALLQFKLQREGTACIFRCGTNFENMIKKKRKFHFSFDQPSLYLMTKKREEEKCSLLS